MISLQNNANQKITLTEIGVYNLKVSEFLKKNKVSGEVLTLTIKNFKDNAYRKKWSVLQYNLAVEDFNNSHGFYIPKKGKESEAKNYNYINYPYLDKDAVIMTMDNYRAYRDKYNDRAFLQNIEINDFNKTVLPATTPELKLRIKTFQKQNTELFTLQYNEQVDKFNAVLGKKYVKKRRVLKIRHSLDNIFNVFLGFQVGQLKARNAKRMEKGQSTMVLKNQFPRIEMNYTKTIDHKINGNRRLDVCRKTLYNAIQRLIEAGVLGNYLFINKKRPVYFNINTEILHVLDGKIQNNELSKNQPFSLSKEKQLPTLNNTTSTLIKRNKEDDSAIRTDHNATGSRAVKQNENYDVRLAGSYKVTSTLENQKISSKEIKKIIPDFLKGKKAALSGFNKKVRDNVLKNILNENELAKMLAEGKFDTYKGVRKESLLKVTQCSGLSFEEIKEFVIQDFIKSSAKIWKNHNVYVGEWKKTINNLNEVFFKDWINCSSLIAAIKKNRWKLEFARKWFEHSKVNALYPSAYFDKTRTLKKEVGFFALEDAWKKKHNNSAKKSANDDLQAKSNARKRAISKKQLEINKQNTARFRESVRNYVKGNISKRELITFVTNNLPKGYLGHLSALITTTNQTNHA
ncbi:hypothetical protein [Tenacibaculum finnmarkense]|uniref:hypothetical protein n=1 Tax=Tenacibaculum finnmarkense TaxID=2781243 RepID=UPI00187B5D27|nr:hypothetical protein [Tenacibaculum finnmarkense]MBE7649252.1 hypothetical protein [Tenacibaculum finnmarkense genomovar ulcerans]